jgi:phage baseplate assembly protein gpV
VKGTPLHAGPALVPDLIGIVQAVVRDELAALRVAEIGVVTDVFPHADEGDQDNYACSVRLRDTGLELDQVPVATQRIGLSHIPNVDDLVLVSFVGGTLEGAVITARLYNDVDRPPVASPRECVFESPDDAESGLRRLSVTLPNSNTLLVDDDKVVLSMGETTITINNGGDVQIDSNAKVVINSTGNTEVTSQGDITLDATGSLSLKAQGDVSIEGMSVAVKAQTAAQVEGQASTTVKGPMISISGVTSFSPG